MGNEETKKIVDIEDNINDFIDFGKKRMWCSCTNSLMFTMMFVVLCMPFYKIGGTSFGIMDLIQGFFSLDRDAWLENSLIGSLVNGTFKSNTGIFFDPDRIKITLICMYPLFIICWIIGASLSFWKLVAFPQIANREMRKKQINKEIGKKFYIGNGPFGYNVVEVLGAIITVYFGLILNYTYAQQLVSVSGGIMEYNSFYFLIALFFGGFGVVATIIDIPVSAKFYRLFNVIVTESYSQ